LETFCWLVSRRSVSSVTETSPSRSWSRIRIRLGSPITRSRSAMLSASSIGIGVGRVTVGSLGVSSDRSFDRFHSPLYGSAVVKRVTDRLAAEVLRRAGGDRLSAPETPAAPEIPDVDLATFTLAGA